MTKTVDFGDFKIEIIERYKDDELEMFSKGKKIVESCTSHNQLDAARKVVDLISKQFIGVSNALQYSIELRSQEITEMDMINENEAIGDIKVNLEE
jgi:hypothetical protein